MNIGYATVLCGGDRYLAGVEALGRSIADTGSRLPRIVMVTSDVSMKARERLTSQGWQLREIDNVSGPTNQEAIYERFAHSFSKLCAFNLVDFDKIVFLDADTVVLSRIEELFDRPAIAAAPDFFMPDCFNSGVMVIQPSHALYTDLVAEVGKQPTYDGGDQGLLNSHWPDWWAMSVEHRLPAGYNMHHFVYQFMISHSGLRRSFIDKIKIIHYTLQKPWQQFTVTGGSQVWWQKFYGAHPEASSAWRKRLHILQDRSFDRFVNMLGG